MIIISFVNISDYCNDSKIYGQAHPEQQLANLEPLQPHQWEKLLQATRNSIVAGLCDSLRVGFNQEVKLKACTHNMLSRMQFSQVSNDYIVPKPRTGFGEGNNR